MTNFSWHRWRVLVKVSGHQYVYLDKKLIHFVSIFSFELAQWSHWRYTHPVWNIWTRNLFFCRWSVFRWEWHWNWSYYRQCSLQHSCNSSSIRSCSVILPWKVYQIGRSTNPTRSFLLYCFNYCLDISDQGQQSRSVGWFLKIFWKCFF